MREVPEAKGKKNFHNEFKSWVLSLYDSMDEDKWLDVLRNDEEHDYI